MNRENDADTTIINVTEEEYYRDLSRGFHEDEVMEPGRHKFKRGGFLRRHGIDARQPKIRISVDIDRDAVCKTFFKQKPVAMALLAVSASCAAPFQPIFL